MPRHSTLDRRLCTRGDIDVQTRLNHPNVRQPIEAFAQLILESRDIDEGCIMRRATCDMGQGDKEQRLIGEWMMIIKAKEILELATDSLSPANPSEPIHRTQISTNTRVQQLSIQKGDRMSLS
jgi:hypothetical protein